MDQPIILLLIIISLLYFIIKASDYFITSASNIATHFGISDLIIGLTIVALGTSAPEFVVSTIAAGRGEGALSLSNIVGSNIFVLGFTLGFVGLFTKAITNKIMLYRDCSVLLIATFLLYFFLLDGVMARWEGGVFLALFAFWFYLLFKIKEKKESEITNKTKISIREFGILAGSLATILLTGHFLVETSVAFARLVGVSEWMIGITIIAIGTSLPEFVTSLMAIIKKRIDMSIGGLIGSGVFNIIGIIGTSAVIKPIVPGPIAANSILMLLITMVIMTIFLATGKRLSRWEATVLMIIAIVRIIMDIMAG